MKGRPSLGQKLEFVKHFHVRTPWLMLLLIKPEPRSGSGSNELLGGTFGRKFHNLPQRGFRVPD